MRKTKISDFLESNTKFLIKLLFFIFISSFKVRLILGFLLAFLDLMFSLALLDIICLKIIINSINYLFSTFIIILLSSQ